MSENQSWYYVNTGGKEVQSDADSIKKMLEEGTITRTTRVWTKGMTSWTTYQESDLWDGPPPINAFIATSKSSEAKAHEIGDWVQNSAYAWYGIATLQLLTGLVVWPLLLCAIWNFFAATSQSKLAKRVKRLDKDIPAKYRDMSQFILWGFFNFFLGGAIAIIFTGVDLYIRSMVMENAQYFTNDPVPTGGASNPESNNKYTHINFGNNPPPN